MIGFKQRCGGRSRRAAMFSAVIFFGTLLASLAASAAFNFGVPFDSATALTQKGALERGPNVNLCDGDAELAKNEPFKYFDNDTNTGHPYQVYDIYNPGGAACRDITMSWKNGDCGDLELGVFVYNGTFNPNDITQNLLAAGFNDNRGKGKIDAPGTDASAYRYSPGFDRYGGFLGQDYHTDFMRFFFNVPAFAHLQVAVVAKRKSSDTPLSCSTPRIYSDSLAVSPAGFTVEDTQSFEFQLGGGAKLSFPVRLQSIAAQTLTVQYATLDGTGANPGIANVDYVPVSGQLTFLPGQDVQYVDVPIIGNSTPQPNRNVRLQLSNPGPAGVQIVRSTATGTIIDDDAAVCRFTAPTTLPNGTVGTPYGPVNFLPTGGDAINDFQISVQSGTLPGGLNFTVTDPPGIINAFGVLAGTPTTAGAFTFTLQLLCPLGEGGTESYTQNYTLVIDNGVPEVFVTLPDVQHLEGNAGLTPVTMTVSLSATRQVATVFNIVTQDATATVAENDYVPITNQQVTVPAGQLSATFTVNFKGDTVPEGDEQFLVQLFHTVGSQELAASAVVTIVNDDALPVPEAPHAIPSLSQEALGALVVLLGLAAVAALRRATHGELRRAAPLRRRSR